MLRSVLVGMDGSAYSTAAVELGIRLAQRWDAVLVGLGVVDAPTICKAQPVPLGAMAYKVQRDKTLLADAHRHVGRFLEHCAQQCARAGVKYQVRREVGVPAACLLTEAQRSDLLVLWSAHVFSLRNAEPGGRHPLRRAQTESAPGRYRPYHAAARAGGSSGL